MDNVYLLSFLRMRLYAALSFEFQTERKHQAVSDCFLPFQWAGILGHREASFPYLTRLLMKFPGTNTWDPVLKEDRKGQNKVRSAHEQTLGRPCFHSLPQSRDFGTG